MQQVLVQRYSQSVVASQEGMLCYWTQIAQRVVAHSQFRAVGQVFVVEMFVFRLFVVQLIVVQYIDVERVVVLCTDECRLVVGNIVDRSFV